MRKQGGTSGIGAQVVQELATRGAQVILLTRQAPSDPFLVDYIEDLRSSTNNQLVYAEQVDLSSLLSIRAFATKWVDNAPPRRLDMIVLCAGVMTPTWAEKKATTMDGLDEEWQVNYLSNYHLLSILSPALRAQPADRDVRVILSTCSSYIGAKMDLSGTVPSLNDKTNARKKTQQSNSPILNNEKKKDNMYATSKLSLMIFAQSFQKHLDAYKRPDKQPNNTRVLIVDPGICRTPGTRRWLTGGSLWGLLFYLISWPFWWLVLKSPQQGAQNYLWATMEAALSCVGGRVTATMAANGVGGEGLDVGVGADHVTLIKEVKERTFLRSEITDEATGKKLWEFSQTQIEAMEKDAAIKRAQAKKETEELEKKDKEKEMEKTTEKQGANASGASDKAKTSQETGGKAPGSRRSRKGK